LTYTDLAACVREKLGDEFKGSIRWYVEAVKLDLEARKIIERVPQAKSPLYRVKGSP